MEDEKQFMMVPPPKQFSRYDLETGQNLGILRQVEYAEACKNTPRESRDRGSVSK